MSEKMKVVILGSGNIGSDLLSKVLKSSLLECRLFIGRNEESPGLQRARELGVNVSFAGIQAIINDPDICDLVFDATSATEHIKHDAILRQIGKQVIDMTPARVGKMVIPAINLEEVFREKNINMVSCGGQAAIPLAYAVAQTHPRVDYLEVVSSISSSSAGPATRSNLDEYINTTENAMRFFTGCSRAKTILILNPAAPPIEMQTTISAIVPEANLEQLGPVVDKLVNEIKRYVPGYQLLVPPLYEYNRIVMMVKVTGSGDYLPPYAGNLDIINCAAIAAAEAYAKKGNRAE